MLQFFSMEDLPWNCCSFLYDVLLLPCVACIKIVQKGYLNSLECNELHTWSDAWSMMFFSKLWRLSNSINLMTGYLNVDCFRIVWRNWLQDTQRQSLLKLSPQTASPTTQIGMFLQYWCITTVLSKGLMLVCRSLVERDAHLNVSYYSYTAN